MLWLLLFLPITGDEGESEIAFRATVAEARASEQAPEDGERRPVVIMFHAPWCGWCRKMQVDTIRDPEVTALVARFLWVRLDVDEHPDEAARFEVTGLPDTFILNSRDEVIASQSGYMPPDLFAPFLTDALENPQPPRVLLQDLLNALSQDGSEEQRRETVTRIVEHLAAPDREGRQESLATLVNAGPANWPTLLELMADERLAMRAAAGGALSRACGADLPFDPFEDAAARELQVQHWREWMIAAPLKGDVE